MKVKILKAGVFHSGLEIPVGTVADTDEASARSLIAGEYAEHVQEAPENGENSDGEVVDGGNKNSSEGKQDGADSEALTRQLDAKYKRDDIYEAAKEAGVEIAYDAKKAEIIAAVIEAGKGSELLA